MIKSDGSLNDIQTITLLDSISQDQDISREDTTYDYIEIAPEEAKTLLDKNPDIIIVDVSPYFDNGHLPGAVNYNIATSSSIPNNLVLTSSTMPSQLLRLKK